LADEKLDDILPPGKRAELEEKYGEILAIRTKAGPAAFKGPSRVQYRRHLSQVSDEKMRGERIDQFVIELNVFPGQVEFSAMLDRKPGIAVTCYSAILAFAGLEDDKETKKYETGAEGT
jgi:hypothetical protein